MWYYEYRCGCSSCMGYRTKQLDIDNVYDSSQCYNEECTSYEEEVNIDWVLPEDVKPTSQDALDAKVERF